MIFLICTLYSCTHRVHCTVVLVQCTASKTGLLQPRPVVGGNICCLAGNLEWHRHSWAKESRSCGSCSRRRRWQSWSIWTHVGVDCWWLRSYATTSSVRRKRGQGVVVEHWVIGGGISVLQTRSGHTRQVAHAAVVGSISVGHGADRLWNGWIHGVESSVEW